MIPESVAYLAVPEPEPIRRHFYRELGRAMEAAASRAFIAFVSETGAARPWVFVRPRSLLDVVFADPLLARAELAPPLERPSLGPSEGVVDRWGVAAPPDPRCGSPAAADPFDREDPRPLVGPFHRLGVQTLWASSAPGMLWTACRWRVSGSPGPELERRFEAISLDLSARWSSAAGRRCVPGPVGRSARSDWSCLGSSSLPDRAWIPLGPERFERTPELWSHPPPRGPPGSGSHLMVLGASGAGKTWYLADRAADAIGRGQAVLAIDLHGDLAPSIVARLAPEARRRIVCVDLADRPTPGIAAIAPNAPPERAAAHLVAALKRLTPDGTDVYWGFRLERILDSFVRLVQESGGSLLDLHALLSDPDRRDAARLATRSEDLARFLEEVEPAVRRSPDLLWGASARLAKVANAPALAEFLAPGNGGLPAEELLREGRPLLVRAPFAQLGPEAASFAGTLVLARVYLGLAARRSIDRPGPTVHIVLDEVQGLSPRLIAEMVAEGRKFGVRLLLATQFPERLAPELRSTVTGVVGEFVAFRVPRPSAGSLGAWLGLSPVEAEHGLSDLPPGHGLARGPGDRGVRRVVPAPAGALDLDAPWTGGVRSTREEFGAVDLGPGADRAADDYAERLMLAIWAAEEEGRPLRPEEVPRAAAGLAGPALELAVLADRLPSLERQGLTTSGDGMRLTNAGRRRLGWGRASGATREGPVHRTLLLATFRLFARHGHRLEILRQGRFDLRLPDARFRQLPDRLRSAGPSELAQTLDRIRAGWAWRFFRGMDVHVEAEVSGAPRADRIRRGVEKAQAHRAFALFVVADAHAAARVRSTLRRLGVGVDRGQVWTLPVADPSVRPPSTPRERFG